ncbi:hypothetical protein ACFW35_15120 [Fictibacillus sp. NPDC058756]|uniref:hypothetical protein n=1 Tax=Fictibacillus sp. NPDC058756 TaxID=3346625 RepID=UPI003687C5E5
MRSNQLFNDDRLINIQKQIYQKTAKKNKLMTKLCIARTNTFFPEGLDPLSSILLKMVSKVSMIKKV